MAPITRLFYRREMAAFSWRRIATIVVVLSIANFGLFLYPSWRIADLLMGAGSPGLGLSLALALLPISIWFFHEWRGSTWTRWLAVLALGWMTVAFQLFVPVLLRDLAALVVPIPERASGLALAALALGLFVVGSINAKRLHVKTIRLPIAELEGKRLVQISDVHLGSRSAAFLRRVVEQVRALEPDYVVITGDLVDGRGADLEALAAFEQIDAPIYFVLGNHERYIPTRPILEALERYGVRVLSDASAIDGPIQFIGLDDAEARDTVARGLERLSVSRQHVPILLYHRPAELEAAERHGIRLMLSGHTHWGQIIPFNFFVGRAFARWRGLHELGETTLYVSPGTGTWGPVLRTGSRSEITRFLF